MVTCETVATLGGAYALDLLPPEEADAMTVHLATCVGCGERTRARLQAGEWLAHLVAPEPLPEDLRRRLQMRLQDPPRPQPKDTAPLTPVALPASSPGRRPWLWWLIAAGLAALIAWNLGLQGHQQSLERAQRLTGEAQAQLLTHMRRQQQAQRATPPTTVRLSRLQGSRRYPAAAGTLAWQADGGRWTLTAQGLPALPPGQVFQLWAGGGDRPAPVVACRSASSVLAVPVPAHGALRPGTPLLLTVEFGAAREKPAGELVLLGLVAE